MPIDHVNRLDRVCLCCQNVLEGRADKQFCSSACKARFNREHAKQLPALAPPVSVPVVVSPTAYPVPMPANGPLPPGVPVVEHWAIIYMRREKERVGKELLVRFHAAYSRQVIRFLKEEGSLLSAWQLADLLSSLELATQTYRQHPGLLQNTHPARTRIADLYWMQDILRDLQGVKNPGAAPSFWTYRKTEPEPVRLQLPSDQRTRLRENMLGPL